MKQDYICKECNTGFTKDNCGKNPQFCCKNCQNKYREKKRKHYICKNCGKEFIRHELDKNKTYCCPTCYKDYRIKNAIQTPEYKKEWDRQYSIKYNIEHKADILIKGKEYREKNIDVIRKKAKTPKGKYSNYKSIAKRRNIEFNLTLEQFSELWNKPCHYCGNKITTIGVDRVDNTIGYNTDNIVPCCSWCNRMKLNYTEEAFLNQCKQIVEFNKLLTK